MLLISFSVEGCPLRPPAALMRPPATPPHRPRLRHCWCASCQVGKEGVITVQDGKTLENELEVVEGMKFDRGYISPYFVTDQKTMKCELEDPFVLIVEKKISGIAAIIPVLEQVLKTQRPLLIISEDVESGA